MTTRGRGVTLLACLFLISLLAACGGGTADMLDTIKQAGKIKVVTDPAYPPQSEQLPDGTLEGFDVDVANEIAKRLGVTAQFEPTTNFDLVQGGGWAGRWDISVGSVTITEERKVNLDFTRPYYFTPAQIGVVTDSGITSLEGLAGKTICMGSGTTYQFWILGTLALGDGSALAPVPQGAQVTTFDTDTQCADAIKSGRRDFQAWLTASETLAAAIAEGAPFTLVGDPVFYEPLAIAVDKKNPTHTRLVAELDRIVGEMHSDGTLSTLSKKWYEGRDLTVRAGQ